MISLAGSGAAGYISATGRGDAQYHLKEYPENIMLEYPENIMSTNILKISS